VTTAIWGEGGNGWALLRPVGFTDEATLHGLVEDSPQLLPLSGTPRLTVLGREVRLGPGYADLVGIESGGRPVIIEVKLAGNSEARRAVVAQVLSYATYLHRLTPESFEDDVLGTHLAKRGYKSVLDAAREADQEGALDDAEFAATLRDSLASGEVRLVLVLDAAPDELVRLVGYLQTVSPALTIDLITEAAYEVGGTRVLVPQRVEPEREYFNALDLPASSPRPGRPNTGYSTPGADAFIRSIDDAPSGNQPALRKLAEWAVALQDEGLIDLSTYLGKRGEVVLNPRLRPDNAGLVTIYNWMGGPSHVLLEKRFRAQGTRLHSFDRGDRWPKTRTGKLGHHYHRSSTRKAHRGVPFSR
jgi:hypothetical protein